MCLIILAPKDVRVPDDYVTNAFITNDDGAGVAYVRDGKVIIEKGFFKVHELKEALLRIGTDTPRLIHFRFATLGVVNTENCHPFPLAGSSAAFAHNGPCVHDDYQGDALRSDSRHLAEDLLTKYDQPTLQAVKPLLEGFVNSGNKLAFLFPDGEHMLVNEDLGEWRNGVWLSNTYSVEKPNPVTYSWPKTSSATTYSSRFADSGSQSPVDNWDKVTLIIDGELRDFHYDWDSKDWWCYSLYTSLEELLPQLDRNQLADVRIVMAIDAEVIEYLAGYGINTWAVGNNLPVKTTKRQRKQDRKAARVANFLSNLKGAKYD